MTHTDIMKRVSALNADMLERRKALNEEHFYPRLSVIQADCAAIGHVKGAFTINMVGSGGWYKCGYCGAHVENVSFDADGEAS
jgi:hypothetical protein